MWLPLLFSFIFCSFVIKDRYFYVNKGTPKSTFCQNAKNDACEKVEKGQADTSYETLQVRSLLFSPSTFGFQLDFLPGMYTAKHDVLAW